MQNKSYKTFLILIGVLVAISFGLVAFSAAFLNNKPIEYKQYYAAVRDIPAYSELKSDFFKPISVPTTVNMEGMVDNLSNITGRYNTTSMKQGEYLIDKNVSMSKNEEDLVYSIELQATYVADVAYDDNVDIYSLNQDNSVTLMFQNKKIYRAKTAAIADAATTEMNTTPQYESASKMYIHVTKNEMLKYYTSLRDCRLIVLPYNVGVEPEDINGSNVINDNNIQENEVQETFEYIAQDGDTFEVIADNFQVEIETLKEINADITEISEGDVINIPSN